MAHQPEEKIGALLTRIWSGIIAAIQIGKGLLLQIGQLLREGDPHSNRIRAGIQSSLIRLRSLRISPQFRRILIRAGTVIFLFFFLLLPTATYLYYLTGRAKIGEDISLYKKWLSRDASIPERPPVRIVSRNGETIGEYLIEKNSVMELNRCSHLSHLKKAAVSSEDRNFYEHSGISLRGILRAFINNIISFRFREGASSITQQLARNVFISHKMPDIIRKFYEIFTAFQIERTMTKDEILCLYLNRIYMGEGRYGAEQAAEFYFRKPPEELDAAEAAMIVGLFPSPVYYSPLNDISNSLKKQELVLDAMIRDGHLKEAEKKALLASFRRRYGVDEKGEVTSGTIGIYGANTNFRMNLAPDVNEYVRKFFIKEIPEEFLGYDRLTVHTTISVSRQRAAIEAMRSAVRTVRQATAIPEQMKKRSGEITDALNGVFLSVDPNSGDILAMVGGYDISEYRFSNLNRIWNMRRQPGSTIKGFLYALALDEGILNVDSNVNDAAIQYSGYQPKNWYGDYKGEIPLRTAVAESVNTVAVETLRELGPRSFIDKLSRASGTDLEYEPNLSLALGSGELTPVELAKTYSVILNGGKSVDPHLITRIEDSSGNILYEYEPTSSSRVISEQAARDARSLLESVILDQNATAEWIGRILKERGALFPVAAKTGTVRSDPKIRKKFSGMSGVHDAWFVALVPGEANVVWIGSDIGAPFPGSGAGSAGSAWLYYALNALKGNIPDRFETDEGSFFSGIFRNDPEIRSPSNGNAVQFDFVPKHDMDILMDEEVPQDEVENSSDSQTESFSTESDMIRDTEFEAPAESTPEMENPSTETPERSDPPPAERPVG
jgi:membrane peptidoglycan carboxypeptidase